jgi:hypothetical protein
MGRRQSALLRCSADAGVGQRAGGAVVADAGGRAVSESLDLGKRMCVFEVFLCRIHVLVLRLMVDAGVDVGGRVVTQASSPVVAGVGLAG